MATGPDIFDPLPPSAPIGPTFVDRGPGPLQIRTAPAQTASDPLLSAWFAVNFGQTPSAGAIELFPSLAGAPEAVAGGPTQADRPAPRPPVSPEPSFFDRILGAVFGSVSVFAGRRAPTGRGFPGLQPRSATA